jgi:hypothetical protein
MMVLPPPGAHESVEPDSVSEEFPNEFAAVATGKVPTTKLVLTVLAGEVFVI